MKKKCSENLLNIFLTVKTEWPNVWAPKIFFTDFWDILKYTKVKKIVVHSKPFIKVIGILLLIDKFL